jgi:hypothetical protein
MPKIYIPSYAFLPALHNLKDACAVEVRSSSSQPASHGFLDCLVCLVVVTSQVIFQGPEKMVVWGGQIRTKGWMEEQFPAILCSCVTVSKRGTQRAAISVTIILPSFLMSSSTFCLLRSVATVLGRPQRGWSAMSVFPSLKCFTHLLTLLVPMQASPYTARSRCRWLLPSFPLSQVTQWQQLTKIHVSDRHFLAVHDGNVRGAHALNLRTCWRGKMPLMVLSCPLLYSLIKKASPSSCAHFVWYNVLKTMLSHCNSSGSKDPDICSGGVCFKPRMECRLHCL